MPGLKTGPALKVILTGHFAYWTVRILDFRLLPGQFAYRLLILPTRLPE